MNNVLHVFGTFLAYKSLYTNGGTPRQCSTQSVCAGSRSYNCQSRSPSSRDGCSQCSAILVAWSDMGSVERLCAMASLLDRSRKWTRCPNVFWHLHLAKKAEFTWRARINASTTGYIGIAISRTVTYDRAALHSKLLLETWRRHECFLVATSQLLGHFINGVCEWTQKMACRETAHRTHAYCTEAVLCFSRNVWSFTGADGVSSLRHSAMLGRPPFRKSGCMETTCEHFNCKSLQMCEFFTQSTPNTEYRVIHWLYYCRKNSPFGYAEFSILVQYSTRKEWHFHDSCKRQIF